MFDTLLGHTTTLPSVADSFVQTAIVPARSELIINLTPGSWSYPSVSNQNIATLGRSVRGCIGQQHITVYTQGTGTTLIQDEQPCPDGLACLSAYITVRVEGA